MQWMLYGATGYTGQLVVQEAIKRGHTPILAGRNPDKVRTLAQTYGLPHAAFPLEDVDSVAQAIAGVDVVYHAAGPFIETSDVMIRACLATNTHYLDITGEIPVFENTYRYDDAARKNGVALISGVGFDVVPTDCLAARVAEKVPAAVQLDIGLTSVTKASAGTAKSLFGMVDLGGAVRRDGVLVNRTPGSLRKSIPMPQPIGEKRGMAIPWGDLATAYRSTGIPNITTYAVVPPALLLLARLTGWMLPLMKNGFVQARLRAFFESSMRGPNPQMRETAQSYVWACATDARGFSAQAWLQTVEPYRYTAEIAIHAVEQVIENQPIGALTPAQAFGQDFVLRVAGTTIWDTLPSPTT